MDVIPDVTPADVAKRYDGDLTAEFRDDYVEAQIGDVVDFALSRWRAQITSRLASGVLTPNLYRRTIANAVLRVLRNPGGLSSEGDGTYNYAARPDVASGALGFTADEVATLIGSGSLGIGTVHTRLDRGWS